MLCGCRFDEDEPEVDDYGPKPMGVDGNGCLTERLSMGESEVVVHYDDIPASDITTVRGIPCTTALRTVIDIAPEVPLEALKSMLENALGRRLFTVDEAWRRLAQPDMVGRRGAELLRELLTQRS